MLALAKLAKALKVVIPISFFEKDGPRYYNSVAVADADGEILGRLPQEPHPRRPRLSGEILFPSRRHRLQGMEDEARHDRRRHLLGPVVPGSGPRHGAGGRRNSVLPHGHRLGALRSTLDTHEQWQRAMQGHAVANAVPIVAANRIGVEENDGVSQEYYGHSFIADHKGELVESFGATEEGVLVHSFDLRRDRALPRRLGLFPRPPHRPLRQKHPLAHVPAMAHADRLTRERIRLEGGKQSQKLSVLSKLSPSSAPLPPLAPLRRGRRLSPCARYCG